jgi:hypothetical protein
VVYGIRRCGLDGGQQRSRVRDLDLLIDLDDVIAAATEMIGQPRAHEAAATGDQGAHDGSPYWLCAPWECAPVKSPPDAAVDRGRHPSEVRQRLVRTLPVQESRPWRLSAADR